MSQATVQNRSQALAALMHPAALFVLLMLVAVRAFAGSVTLAWDPVTSSSLAGYMVYYGPSAGNYTTKVDVGNTTTRAVSNLTDGATYHFAVTAYDASHVESGYSNDVATTIASATAPVANFTASATSGVAPLAMNFTSTSTGTISSYAWTFGDGTASTAQNPSHVYSAAGSYTVGLTVTGSGGSNTKTVPNYITVTSSATAPVAAFSGSPTSGTAPLTVNFTNASTGTISTYAWNFGDGTTSTAKSPSHVYSAAGVYTVTLTVNGSAGSNTKTYSNYVSVAAAPSTDGSLSGNMTVSTATVDLTSTGSSDWARWPSYIHSMSGGGQISNVATIGGGSPKTYYGDARMLKWTNGTPTTTGSTTTGVQVSGKGKGVQITVPADTTTRTLMVYVGAQNTTGTLTAHLSDGSAADYVGKISGQSTRQDGVVTLQYRAKSAGQKLNVQLVQSGASKGNLSLQGAALAVVGSTSTPPPTGSTCPCSIWSSSAAPQVVADSDMNPVEIGVKFKSDVAGYITGIRFYKSSINTGTHIGSLWTSTGTLLAQATFINETASGWQTVTFGTPVAIAANTVYVASYHTNVGHYAGDNAFFATAGVDNPPLHALKDGDSGGNGVYAYTSTPVFPTSSWSASNYWVDVTFQPN